MRPLRGALLAGWLGTAGIALLPICAASEGTLIEPERLLEQMAQAQQQLEYEGTLVYLHGHHLATLRIARRIEHGVSKESLFSLSGPIRAVARNERGVTCMLPDSRAFLVPRDPRQDTVLRIGPYDFERIRLFYRITALGASRVAGRDTDVIGVVPKDELRYGHRFYIDRETGLPLKIDLLSTAGEPIEQVMFTSLDVIGTAKGELGQSLPPRESAGVPPIEPVSAPSNLPPGFSVVSAEQQKEGGGILQHLLVSDGLASVSLYLEPAFDGALDGATRMGSMTAVGRRVDDHQVTAIGEVPEQTARMLVDGFTARLTAASQP
ncbi:MAG: MucB/RseB C-terminal domain-containing protein [Thiohalocapsa sp.]|jgi:sigma-E factor negative regulatory protein RseB